MLSPPTPKKKSPQKRILTEEQRQTIREKERQLYAHYQQIGICTTCRKTPAEEGSTRCADCNELRKQKYFQPRTEETRTKREIGYRKRNEIVLTKIKEHKILYKPLSGGLYQTPQGTVFFICSVSFHRYGDQIGMTYRIRNEKKLEFDYWVAYYAKDDSVYVYPKKKNLTVEYFRLEDMELYKNEFEALKEKM